MEPVGIASTLAGTFQPGSLPAYHSLTLLWLLCSGSPSGWWGKKEDERSHLCPQAPLVATLHSGLFFNLLRDPGDQPLSHFSVCLFYPSLHQATLGFSSLKAVRRETGGTMDFWGQVLLCWPLEVPGLPNHADIC